MSIGDKELYKCEHCERSLKLLKREGTVDDLTAIKSGITNPRREAGLIARMDEHEVNIFEQAKQKREYSLL